MSLINDALKRAQEVQRKDTPFRVQPMLAPMSAETRRNERKVGWVLPIVIIFFIAGAFTFYWLTMANHTASLADKKIDAAPTPVAARQTETLAAPAPTPAATPAPATPAPAPVAVTVQPTETVTAPAPIPAPAVVPAPTPAPPVVAAAKPVEAAPVPAPTAPAPAATPAEVVSPAIVQPPTPLPPLPLTLVQGIAADSAHPWAIINRRTVSVGDYVSGMRVIEISRHSVTLVGYGQTNNLVVGEQ